MLKTFKNNGKEAKQHERNEKPFNFNRDYDPMKIIKLSKEDPLQVARYVKTLESSPMRDALLGYVAFRLVDINPQIAVELAEMIHIEEYRSSIISDIETLWKNADPKSVQKLASEKIMINI